MKQRKNILLLFDIDGTLIHQVGRSGITSNRFAYAVNKVFKVNTNADMLSVYGQVDTETLLELAEKGGIKRNAAKKRLNKLYYFTTKYFRDHLKHYNTHVHEGVKPFLSKLRRKGYILGLVTGNIKPIAKMKLKKLGLYSLFDIGAFGEMSNQRSDLLLHAIVQANRKFGTKFTNDRVIYFGDAPLDIKAAKKAKIKIISVTTGHYTMDILKKEKPDYILKDMSNHDRIFRIIKKIENGPMKQPMAKSIIVLGKISTDIKVDVDYIPEPKEQITAKRISYFPGGKGSNQAVAAKRLGGNVSLVTCIGTDYFGKNLLSFLKSEGLDTRYIKFSKTTPTGMAMILLDKNADNTIISIPGSERKLLPSSINAVKFSENNIALSQLGLPETVIIPFLKRAKANGSTTILNTAPRKKSGKKIFKFADYLIANESEAAFYAGSKRVSQDPKVALKYARRIRSRPKQIVIVTLGGNGLVAVAGEEVIRIPGIKVNVVDTSGAGDTFVGAFATALSEGMGLKESLEFANKAASITVQRPGASSSPTRKELKT